MTKICEGTFYRAIFALDLIFLDIPGVRVVVVEQDVSLSQAVT